MLSTFDSFDSIVNYLREPTLFSTVTDSQIVNNNKNNDHDNVVKPSKKQQAKGKDLTIINNTTPPPQPEGNIQILPKGRVRYGPITVNPRKQPSKTLFTGRRSKYEVLSGDEEEKRRDRRERNRVAATKCREKRENVLGNLENEHNHEVNNNKRLIKLVNDLQQQKNELEIMLSNHENECLLINNTTTNNNNTTTSSMIFGDPTFLSSIIDAPALPLPIPTYQEPVLYSTDDEELSHILDRTPLLTNSAYNTEESNSLLTPPVLPMTTSSIDRLINTLQSPTISMDSINNHSILFNSAFNSSCAKQHSNSSEDESVPPKCTNHCVY